MVKWMLRVVFEKNLLSKIGRACLIEIECKSRWWSRCRHISNRFGLMELVNLIWLIEVTVNGMANLSMNIDGELWKKYICERIQEGGKESWKDDKEREICTNYRMSRKLKGCTWKCLCRSNLMVRDVCH